MDFFAKALNQTPIARYFTRAADLRRRAFEAILWNDRRGQWLDYWLPLQKPSAKLRKVITFSADNPDNLRLRLPLALIMSLILDVQCDAEPFHVGLHQIKPKPV